MKLYGSFESQVELDAQYNAGAAVPERDAIIEGWMRRSEAARQNLACEIGIKYGPTREEYLDVFRAAPGAPAHLFIHGGYWRAFSARDHSFVARPLVEAGITTIVVNYALCPKVTIDEIVRQVRAAAVWIWTHADRFAIDRDRLTMSGHSAGGHLTAMALDTDWPDNYDLPAGLIASGVAISGLFDLEPFPYTYLQPALQLNTDQIRRNSPIRQVRSNLPSLITAYGGAESSEFKRQSLDYAAARQAAGSPTCVVELPGLNHFTVLDAIEDTESRLFANITQTAFADPSHQPA